MKVLSIKIIPVAIIAFIAVFIALAPLHLSDITSLMVRTAAGLDLSDQGIGLEYGYVAQGLRQSPFVLPFTRSVKKFSQDRISIDVVNTYTVGSFDKDRGSSLSSVSNFYDPTSKFKDSWFGVYIIKDDSHGDGRRFMLINPAGQVDDLYNLNPESMLELVRLDQMVVVHTSRQNQEGYDRNAFIRGFPFEKISASEVHDVVFDRAKNPWFRINASFVTVSAVTDIEKTDMKLFSSIRAFVGLPDREVYGLVDPWHRTVLRGCSLARYVPCPGGGFWAVVYYNGSAFETKQGGSVDTWANSDIQKEFWKMFLELRIGCGG